MFAKISNGAVERFPYTLSDLRRENPNVSFPATVPDAELASYGVERVTATTAPASNARTHTLERSCSLVDGVWTEVWTETQRDLAIAQKNIREQRNELLSKTDWTQLSDSSVASTWTTYRQELRDVPAQEGFPYSVTWPTEPS
jgi:hypothetical protein